MHVRNVDKSPHLAEKGALRTTIVGNTQDMTDIVIMLGRNFVFVTLLYAYHSDHQGEGEEVVMVMFTQGMRDQDQAMQTDTEIAEDDLLNQAVCMCALT